MRSRPPAERRGRLGPHPRLRAVSAGRKAALRGKHAAPAAAGIGKGASRGGPHPLPVRKRSGETGAHSRRHKSAGNPAKKFRGEFSPRNQPATAATEGADNLCIVLFCNVFRKQRLDLGDHVVRIGFERKNVARLEVPQLLVLLEMLLRRAREVSMSTASFSILPAAIPH